MTKTATSAAVFGIAILQCTLFVALAMPFLCAAKAGQVMRSASVLQHLPAGWRDDRGETLRLPTLEGRRIFVTMAYTTCHSICPMTMQQLNEIQRELDARGLRAEMLIVSYDPSNDDSSAWRRYRESHHLLRNNWHFLIGTEADTQRLARVLGFEFWRDGDHVMHDFRIVALGGDGAERGVIDTSHRHWQDLL